MSLTRGAAIVLVVLSIQGSFAPSASGQPDNGLNVAICSDDSVHVLARGGYHVLENQAQEWRASPDVHPPSYLLPGSDGYLYGRDGSSASYLRYDCSGRQVGSAVTTSLQGHTVVSDGNGKYLYFKRNGTVDSANTLHIFDRDSGGLTYTTILGDGMTLENRTLIPLGNSWFYPRVDIDKQDLLHVLGGTGPSYLSLATNGSVMVGPFRLEDDLQTQKVGWDLRVDSKGNVHIVDSFYRVVDGPAWRLRYTKLGPDGRVVVDSLFLTPPGVDSREPNLAIDSTDSVHLTWDSGESADPNSPHYRFYMRLDDNGTVLSGPTNLDKPSANLLVSASLVVGVGTAVAAFVLWRRQKRRTKEESAVPKKQDPPR